jgi:hypothetical protein
VPISAIYDGSPFAQTLDASTSKKVIVRLLGISAVKEVTATTTTIVCDGNVATVQATVVEVMAVVDPAPDIPIPPPPPPDDITHGKLRINPEGTVIARELAVANPKGDWVVIAMKTGEINWFYTTNVKNPEINTWPYLMVAP